MADPVDWFTVGKLIWVIETEYRRSGHMPDKISVHPVDRYRILQRTAYPGYLGPAADSLVGVPIEVTTDRAEHVGELVYPGWRWVPVPFDPLDFPEPWPPVVSENADTLRAAGYPK